MAKRYTNCPRQKNAKEAWKYFVRKHNKPPLAMWKMANCFKTNNSPSKGLWGLWLADYGDMRDQYDPTKPEQPKAQNIFSFIKSQILLEEQKP